MAKVKKIPAVTRTEIVEIAPEKIVLELTEDEAQRLMVLVGLIHGSDPISHIYASLAGALGLEWAHYGRYRALNKDDNPSSTVYLKKK